MDVVSDGSVFGSRGAHGWPSLLSCSIGRGRIETTDTSRSRSLFITPFNHVLYRSRLVPGWLSLWGLVGGGLLFLYGVLGILGVDTGLGSAWMLLAMPIAVEEMVFAGWLLRKGFFTSRDGRDGKESYDRDPGTGTLLLEHPGTSSALLPEWSTRRTSPPGPFGPDSGGPGSSPSRARWRPGDRSRRRSSIAFTATTIVDTLIAIAPTPAAA